MAATWRALALAAANESGARALDERARKREREREREFLPEIGEALDAIGEASGATRASSPIASGAAVQLVAEGAQTWRFAFALLLRTEAMALLAHRVRSRFVLL